jgi:hypothetical protein
MNDAADCGLKRGTKVMYTKEDVSKHVAELRKAPGESVEERTDFVLSRHGWDKELDKIKDAKFRALCRLALEGLAPDEDIANDSLSQPFV